MSVLSCQVHESGTIELYFYDELPPAGREAVDRHLAGCARCRQALAELAQIRDALAARPVVSGPVSGDWSQFMARLDDAIAGEAPAGAAGETSAPRRYIGYLAMAALVVLVTIIVLVAARSRMVPGLPDVAERVDMTPARGEASDEVTALTSLSEEHLERSKLVVLGLAAKDASGAASNDWAYERQLASRLLGDTRLYRLAAEDRGMHKVANVMRDLELVLLEASLADQEDPATLAQVQQLIRKRDLVQKISVMNTAGL